jgi:predicted RNA methylase
MTKVQEGHETRASSDDEDGADVLFSQFLFHFDMLCDEKRNAAYDTHIERALQRLRNEKAQKSTSGLAVNVLDIGSGSGLLALLARKHGADNVTAIETMPLVAAVARMNATTQAQSRQQHQQQQQLEASNSSTTSLGESIKTCISTTAATMTISTDPDAGPIASTELQLQHLNIESKTSTQVTTSHSDSCPLRIVEAHSTELNDARALGFPNGAPADLVVAEILDSDLIGEGAIPTMRHARQNLVSKSFVSLPATSTIWAALVHGPTVDKLNPPTQQGKDPAGYVFV